MREWILRESKPFFLVADVYWMRSPASFGDRILWRPKLLIRPCMDVIIVTFMIIGQGQGHTKNINGLQNFMNERGRASYRWREREINGWWITQRSSEMFALFLSLSTSFSPLVACSRRSILYIDDSDKYTNNSYLWLVDSVFLWMHDESRSTFWIFFFQIWFLLYLYHKGKLSQ